MGKQMKDTSRFAYSVIMEPGARDNIWKRIILCLEWLPDATNYEMATWLKVKPEKVWKRTGPNELSCPINGAIFDTGLRRPSPDGNPSIVYALSSRRSEYAGVVKEVDYSKQYPSAGDIACAIIAKTKHQKLIQKQLFEES